MHKNIVFSILIPVLMILLVSYLKVNNSLWSFVAVFCVTLSCLQIKGAKVQIDIAIILCALLVSLNIFHLKPDIFSAVVLQFAWVACTVFAVKSKTIGTLFTPLLLLIFLIFEYFSNNSLSLIGSNATIVGFAVIALLNYMVSRSSTPIPITTAVLYCLGASFYQIQLFLIPIVAYELIFRKREALLRTSVCLSIWASLSGLWPFVGLILLFSPNNKFLPQEKLRQLIVPLMLIGSLMGQTDVVVKTGLVVILVIFAISHHDFNKVYSRC